MQKQGNCSRALPLITMTFSVPRHWTKQQMWILFTLGEVYFYCKPNSNISIADYTIRAIDVHSGKEKWNITTGKQGHSVVMILTNIKENF
jgi:hypothetical protein